MSAFLLSIKGQLESAAFPDLPELFVKLQFVYGDDWVVTSGIEEGITQISKRYDKEDDFVFNFPIDITLKSTNPHGWPQIVCCVYGTAFRGHEVIQGYGVCYVPLSLGSGISKTVGLFVPEASSVVSKLTSWMTGGYPELRNPRMLTRNRGREVLRTTSKGCLHFKFNILSKDMRKLEYTMSAKPAPSNVDDADDLHRGFRTTPYTTEPEPSIRQMTNQVDSMILRNRHRSSAMQSRQLLEETGTHDESNREVPAEPTTVRSDEPDDDSIDIVEDTSSDNNARRKSIRELESNA